MGALVVCSLRETSLEGKAGEGELERLQKGESALKHSASFDAEWLMTTQEEGRLIEDTHKTDYQNATCREICKKERWKSKREPSPTVAKAACLDFVQLFI